MSMLDSGGLRSIIRNELDALHGKWPWYLALGIALIVFGTVALAVPYIATSAAILTIGIMLMAGGLANAIGSFWSRDWSGFLMGVLAGALYFVLGLVFVRKPDVAASALTMVIAGLLMASGIVKIVIAVKHRFPQWIWAALSGVLSLLLGFMILNDYPDSKYWVIGLFLGLDMIFHGWFWVMLSLALKRRPLATAVEAMREARAGV